MLDIVLAEIGSFRGWIAWIGRGVVEAMCDLVQLAIVSWSPLELTDTWVFFGIVSGCCCNTPLEVVTLSLHLPPLEVGGGYCSGDNA